MTDKQLIIISSALAGCLALLYHGVQAQGTNNNGLKAEYFNNRDLAGASALNRIDANVAFSWGGGSPGKPIGVNLFSTRWSGQILAPVDGNYVFTTLSDDGVRVWVDGRQVINNWTVHNSRWDNSAAIRLQGGRRYDIRVEYFESGGNANIGLYWLYPGLVQPILVPSKYLFPTTDPGPGNGPGPDPGEEVPPPAIPPTGDFTAPANQRAKGIWLTKEKRKTDQLYWDPVPGAVGYNVYQYDIRIAAGVKDTTYVVPPNLLCSMTYSVTAVDRNGNESIPSNISMPIGAADPAKALPIGKVGTPTQLKAVPEWNGGRPRIAVTWLGASDDFTYNVYRDGKLVGESMWGLTYIDTNLRPGETHTYYVKGKVPPWVAPWESPASNSASAVAPSGPLNNGVVGKVNILSVVPNDDSVMIHFSEVDRAVDYRAYNVAKPGSYKYSGGGLSIEMNGLEPGKRVEMVVEAVDKLGPFQKMDGFYGPGAMNHNGTLNITTNGQGDPSNIPNVVARSEKFAATPEAVTLKGSQAFFDTFRNSQPFVLANSMDPRIIAANGNKVNGPANPYVRELQNDKWIVRNYWGDMDTSRVFVMSNHFMETLYDGGTPRSNIPMHNNNASLIFSPKATADISGGRVLHVTFEVDPHFTSRRWCEVFVTAAGDPVLFPGKFEASQAIPTATGNMFQWVIMDTSHTAALYLGLDRNKKLVTYSMTNGGTKERRNLANGSNGSIEDTDRRHRFDLYLSQNRVQIYEEGKLISDKTMPKGVTLPFTKTSVWFVHQVYHTSNERPGHVKFADNAYYANHRPWADERHWDNMGFEVLNAFPR